MSAARLPGFTAESAIDRSGASYRLRAGAVAPGASPAAAKREQGRWTPGGCDPFCVCVTAEGCPCCDVMAPIQPDVRESTMTMR